MKRFAFAAGVLMTLAAADTQAGYYIVRIVLEGGGDAGTTPEGGGANPMIPGPMIPGPMAGSGRGTPVAGGAEGLQPGGGGARPTGPGPGGIQPPTGDPEKKTAVGDPNRAIVVVVPFTKPAETKPFYPNDKKHSWDMQFANPFGGSTNLFDDNATYQLIFKFQDTPASNDPYTKKGGTKTYQAEVLGDYAKWTKLKNDPPALFSLIVRALDHGMVTEAVAWSRELAELCERTKPQLPARVADFLKAYAAIRGDLDGIAPQPNDAEGWRETIDVGFANAKLEHNKKHYSLIYWDASPDDLRTRFTRLEDNYKAFYLWHATQGLALKAPTQPQIAVLLRGADDFQPMRLAFAGRDEKLEQFRTIDEDHFASRHDYAGLVPLTDAFLAPHTNILVLSSERTDGVGRSFRRSNRSLYQGGMTKQVLLSGGGPPLADGMANPMSPLGPGGSGARPGAGEGGQPPPGPGTQPMPKGPVALTKDEVARAQTTAFVERFDEDATELAALSCEGSRQLLYASGLLPAHVDLPIWLTTGAGEFYQRPRNPVYTPTSDTKAIMAVGLTTGYGRPNFAMHYRFVAMISKKNEFTVAPAQLLKNVVSDSYFTAAAKGLDLDNPANAPKTGADELKRVQALRMKARVTAWAAYYDLIKNQPVELTTFFAELQRLPRDIAIDRHTHLMLFAKAFRLLDEKGNLNDAAFEAFATTWFNRVRQLNPSWVEVEVTTPLPTAGTGGAGGSPLTPPLSPNPMGPGR